MFVSNLSCSFHRFVINTVGEKPKTQQLKTWDFLELAQDEEYGPITISAGPRFHEAPPNEA